MIQQSQIKYGIQLLNDIEQYSNEDILNVVQHLGGIDCILKTLLIADDEKNNSSIKTAEITDQPQHISSMIDEKEDQYSVIKTVEDQKSAHKMKLLVHTNDDIYHFILGCFNKQQFAHKISIFVLSKWMLYIFVPLFIALFVIGILNVDHWLMSLVLSFLVLWMFAVIFVLNTTMVKYVLKTFEFWLKMYYAAVFVLSIFQMMYGNTSADTSPIFIPLFFVIFIAPVFIMSMNDAWRANRFWKIGFIIFPILSFVVYYCVLNFLFSDYFITILDAELSVKDRALSALLNLIIFSVVKAYFVITRPGIASGINVFPTIVWIDDRVANNAGKEEVGNEVEKDSTAMKMGIEIAQHQSNNKETLHSTHS